MSALPSAVLAVTTQSLDSTALQALNNDLRQELEQQRQVTSELEGSVQRLRTLAAISANWYWEQDADYRFTFFVLVPDCHPVDGPQFEDKVGKCRWDLAGTVPLHGSWDIHRALLGRHQPFRDFEYMHVQDGKPPRYVSISGVPVFDEQKHFTGYQGTSRDITSLRSSEARLKTVFASLAEGVTVRDMDGNIVDCNASAERMAGRTLAQMKGNNALAPDWQTLREDGSVFPEKERPNAAASLTGKPQSDVVMRHRKPDGSEFWALVNVQMLLDGTSRIPFGFVTSLTDITKLKTAEMEIVRLNVALEKRVFRRTAQLEAANKELAAFSYSVAHDLRSPLISMEGYGALLQKTISAEPGERAQHYLNRIRSGVQRMGELTDGLLALAQLSRSSIRWETIDMSIQAHAIIQHLCERDTARVVNVAIAPQLLVYADKALIRQVLENLITNAWKFTSKKPLAIIEVGLQSGVQTDPVYFVRDNGAGFDMAYVDKLFGTFQRLHSPEEFPGSGIGLATVHRIIARHGGKIWAHSALDEGATFYFTLKDAQSHAEPAMADSPDHAGLYPDEADMSGASESNASHAPGTRAVSPVMNDKSALTVAQRQFGQAFDHSAIGMVLISLDSRRIKVNHSFCKMVGYSDAELLSRTDLRVTHPDDVAEDLLQLKRALAGELETYQHEKRYVHKSGRIVWGYLTCSLVRDDDRRPLHFISQIQDITERKESEQILRRSEERFRALTELSSDWFWEQDENFRFVMPSGGVKGYKLPQSAIGKTRWEVGHAVTESVWAAHRLTLERREVFRDFEITRLDGDGQLRYLSLSGEPIFDASGRFTGYRGVGHDNTAIRQVSEALRASESQLRQITDTLPALIAYLDSAQRFCFHNRAYEEVFGLTHAQINGQHLRDVLGDDFYEVVKARVNEVLSGYPVAYERTQKTARGTLHDYIVNYFPRYGDGDEDGQVIGFYSLATDITELKRMGRMKSEFITALAGQLGAPLASALASLQHLGCRLADMRTDLPGEADTLLSAVAEQISDATHMLHDSVRRASPATLPESSAST